PQATGVLPIMIGTATRLFDFIQDKGKQYIGEIAFGMATDTQDAYGKVTETALQPLPQQHEIEKVLEEFVGEVIQKPPAYSAIKVNGVRAYQLARKESENIVLADRVIWIDEIIPLWYKQPDRMGFQVTCSKGTYIRTLCYDIGQKLHCPAHMSFLLRTKSGVFTLSQGYTLEEIQQAKENQKLEEILLPLDMPLSHIPNIVLPESQREHCRHGRKMEADAFENLEEDGVYRLYEGKDGKRLLGIAKCQGNQVRLTTYLQSINA
ncbi:MAG: tRNA pseudouridine(55) synthase TruB, partial [Clostridiales bacterium]|nr:tRNA pseudouridine(55) synthase TruB [Clostridiales bacterium]